MTGSAAHKHSLEAAVDRAAHGQAGRFVGVAEHMYVQNNTAVAVVAAPAAAVEVEVEGLSVAAVSQWVAAGVGPYIRPVLPNVLSSPSPAAEQEEGVVVAPVAEKTAAQKKLP